MQYKEYGKQNRDVIILLHGGGLSWWNYREVSERLQNDFRIIIPILDGHAGSDENFTTIEDNAAEIISFIDRNFGGSVLLIGGLSLGAQVLLEMYPAKRPLPFCHGRQRRGFPQVTHSLIKPAGAVMCFRAKMFSKLNRHTRGSHNFSMTIIKILRHYNKI